MGQGLRNPVVTLDEAAATVNQVSDLTLQYGGDINKLEGAGQRVCMGLAGFYWTDKSYGGRGKMRAKTL
eukprot:COSAG05_NODE_2027_length_3672_cov_10.738875_2_plen_69_part_00